MTQWVQAPHHQGGLMTLWTPRSFLHGKAGNLLPQVVFCPSHIHHDICAHVWHTPTRTHAHTHAHITYHYLSFLDKNKSIGGNLQNTRDELSKRVRRVASVESTRPACTKGRHVLTLPSTRIGKSRHAGIVPKGHRLEIRQVHLLK